MVAGQVKCLCSGKSRSFQDIFSRPVLMTHVHVHSGKVVNLISHISHCRKCFQKNLRKKNSGTEIDINSTLKLRDVFSEFHEIGIRCLAENSAIRLRVNMDRICPYCYVYCHINTILNSCSLNAQINILIAGINNMIAD